MANKKIPDKSYLERILVYVPESGKLFWLKNDLRSKQWNTRYGGKEAFTSFTNAGYKHGAINNKNYLAHRVIYKIVYDLEPEEIDHKDGNKNNNKIENLRPSDKSKNQMNSSKRSSCSSVYKGVYFSNGRNKWVSSCNRKHIGYFESELDAAIAYNKMSLEEFGENARLNVLPDSKVSKTAKHIRKDYE